MQTLQVKVCRSCLLCVGARMHRRVRRQMRHLACGPHLLSRAPRCQKRNTPSTFPTPFLQQHAHIHACVRTHTDTGARPHTARTLSCMCNSLPARSRAAGATELGHERT